MNLLECTGLRFGYPGQIALACSDFTVGTGDYIHIAGPNGIGKTTLLRVLAGLLAPLEGRVVRAPELGRGAIGYLPQRSPLQDDFPATVWEVVLSGCQSLRGLRPFHTAHEKSLARGALSRYGIEDLASRSYRELSGGQRQRVLLARSMAVPRRLLLLDEPTTGLDVASVDQFRKILAETRASGTAVVVITHDRSLVDCAPTLTLDIHREGGSHD